MKLNVKILITTSFFLILTLMAGTYVNLAALPITANSNDIIYSTYFGGTGNEHSGALCHDSKNNIIIAGITYSSDFPVTTGAFDTTYNGESDIFVSKWSADGSTLLFSTYLGGTAGDTDDLYNPYQNVELALDSADNIIVVGTTQSNDFPVTDGVWDTTFNGAEDIFISKLSADGSDLLFSTYLGGISFDALSSDGHGELVLDNVDNIYITGLTWSANFPTTENAIYNKHGGESDAFIAKLSADGTTLLYSTFIGGIESYDGGNCLSFDNEGNLIMSGWTWSADFPTTNNAYDDTFDGANDGFIIKLSVEDSQLLYSTFIGGKEEDQIVTMVVDKDNNIYFISLTRSEDFPVTKNAHDSSYDYSGSSDEFLLPPGDSCISKLSADGSDLLYSTYLGGKNIDYCGALSIDKEDNVYITGYTYSDDFPVSENAFCKSFNGETEYFVTSLPSDLSRLRYSTYLGGNGQEVAGKGNPAAIELVNSDNVYVIGSTDSTDFPVSTNAMNKTLNGGSDVFLTHLNWTSLTLSTSNGGGLGFSLFNGVMFSLTAIVSLVWYFRRKSRY